MRTTRFVIALFCIIWAGAIPAFTQVDTDTCNTLGVFGAVNMNMHTADFRALPGIPNCCPQFQNGNGVGFSAGLLYEFPLGAGIGVQTRAGYATHSARLSRSEETLVSVNNVAVQGSFEHSIDATLADVHLEPLIRFSLVKGLSLLAGPHLGFMMTKRYSQHEEITQPTNQGVFLNEQSRQRNVNSGDIPNASALFAAVNLGISYALPLNPMHTTRLVPEVSYSFALSPVVSGYSWNAHALRLGASLQFSFLPADTIPVVPLPPLLPQPAPSPTPKPPVSHTILTSIDVFEVLPNGMERPLKEIVVEEFRSRHLRPLLNYVFFEEDNATLPQRYTRLASTTSFTVDSLVNKGTMETYHHLLNIIGWRMIKKPDAVITLTGCNANIRNEANNTSLSQQRVEAVKEYLTSVWKIDPARIKTQARNLPAIPSGQRTEDGIAENRRVEISSELDDILEPVITNDTLRFPTPTKLRFRPHVTASAGIASWNFSVRFAGQELTSTSGTSEPPAVDVDLSSIAPNTIPPLSEFQATLTARDTRGESSNALRDAPVRILSIEEKRRTRREDKSKDKYSMILFDYAQSGLSQSNRKIMDDVKSRLQAKSAVEVVGHTDRIGSDESNLRLSTKRAEETGKYIAAPNTKSYGKGKRDLLHDNNIPEGRFYCRTVEINVETVVK